MNNFLYQLADRFFRCQTRLSKINCPTIWIVRCWRNRRMEPIRSQNIVLLIQINCSLLQPPTQAPRWHKVYRSRYLGTFPQEYWSPWSYPGSDQHQPWSFTCCDSCGSLGHLVCSVRALYYFVHCDGNSSVYEQGQSQHGDSSDEVRLWRRSQTGLLEWNDTVA